MKIIDCFMYYDEDNLLDLRLNILNKYVDKFIIVESKFTHSGNLKNKNFDLENFKEFKNKIDYYFIENEPLNIKKIDKNDTLEVKNNKRIFNGLLRDNFQRESLNQGIKKLSDEDFIIISDLDEIPNLENINLENLKKKILVFEQKMFYYKLNLLYPRLKWFGSKICQKKYLVSPQWLRNIKSKKYPFWRLDTIFSNKKYQNLKIIPNGGWHFTNMKNAKDLHHKMNNFAHHPEYEDTKYSEEDMANFIKKKLVFYDHFSDKNKNRFENVNELEKVNESYLPTYLVENYEKYKSLID